MYPTSIQPPRSEFYRELCLFLVSHPGYVRYLRKHTSDPVGAIARRSCCARSTAARAYHFARQFS